MSKETCLLVKIIPNAHKSEIVGWENERLKIRIAAVPEKGEANKTLVQFLSEKFLISKSQVIIIQGETSRFKKIKILGMTTKEVMERVHEHVSKDRL